MSGKGKQIPELSSHQEHKMNEKSRHITDELLIRYLAGEQSVPEGEMVAQWVGESADNQAYLEELKKVWGMVGELKEKELVMVDDAWMRFQKRVGEKETPVRRMQPLWQKNWMRIAAVLLVGVAFTAGIIALLNRSAGPDQQQLANHSSEPMKQILSDGSVVHLKPDAVLTYPATFSEPMRRVELEGIAFFEVAKDSLHPFVIETEETKIEVLGTSFLVRALEEEEETEVIVKTGTVAVSAKKIEKAQKLVLEKGMAARHDHKEQVVTTIEAPNELPDIWVPKAFSFTRTPMSEVAQTISEAFGVSVVFQAIDDSDCKLNTGFHGEDLDSIMKIIDLHTEYEVVKQGKGYLIKGSNCQ